MQSHIVFNIDVLIKEAAKEVKAAAPPARPLNAAELKTKGNECFKKAKYKDAVDYYTKAIETLRSSKSRINRSGDLATFHQNRAAAYEKLVCTSLAGL